MRMRLHESAAAWSYCVLPFLVFTILYECLLTGAGLLADRILERSQGEAFAFTAVHAADLRTFLIGAAMLLSLLPFLKAAGDQVRKNRMVFFSEGGPHWKIRQRREDALYAMFFLAGVLFFGIGLNLWLGSAGVTDASDTAAGLSTLAGKTSFPVSAAVFAGAAPFAEEVVFRCLTYGRLREKAVDLVPAMLVSSLLFGFYHGNLAQGIYAAVMGMLFCMAYELTGSLAFCILLHAALNLASLFLAGAAAAGAFGGTGGAAYMGMGAVIGISLYILEKRKDRHER